MDPPKTTGKTFGEEKIPEGKQKAEYATEAVVLLKVAPVSDNHLSIEIPSSGEPSHSHRIFSSRCLSNLEESYECGRSFLSSNIPLLLRLLKALLVILWIVYITYSFVYGGENALPLALLSLVVLLTFLCKYIKRRRKIGKKARETRKSVCSKKGFKWAKRIFYLALLVFILTFIVIDTSRNTENLASLGGLIFFLLFVLLTSTNPFKVKWQPVLWGLAVQFIFALIILRWETGYRAFTFLGDQVKIFLEYSDAGAKFVFDNENYTKHRFVFKILPVLVFFSAVISVLYHWGAIQAVVEGLAWVLQYTMGTTAVESLAAAAHIFVGQLESSVMLRPFLSKLTLSELHAVMATGFATIAGTVIAAYIDFGADPEHLLAASFMSGPAALALAKLGFPETETSLTKTVKDVRLPKGAERNVIEAASVGAANAVKLVAYIVVNVIAFLAILEFVNAVLAFLGQNVGIDGLSFQLICSYLFAPLAAVMGIPWEDTGKVGELIGTKIFINEFVGYAQLGAMIKAGQVQRRTGVIATYILCGFGSIQSMGITLGVFSAVAPERRSHVAGHMVRALAIGNIACFTTACIAGTIYNEHGLGFSAPNATSLNLTTTPWNLTTSATTFNITTSA